MTEIQDLFDKKLAEAQEEYGVELHTKDRKWTTLWKFIHGFLRLVSGGKLDTFYDGYITTVGNKIFFYAGWERHRVSPIDYVILCHELKHVEQFDKYTTGLMALLYLLFPLPIGLAYFRYLFERDAYLESYRASLEVNLVPNVSHYIDALTGSAYLWAWPFRKYVRRWFYENCPV